MAAPGAVVVGAGRSATRRVFSNRAFVVSYAAEAQSIFGDQLARVALAVLVFDLTGSAPATAATYAATFLPAVLGGALLGRVGDRFSRRGVMVSCDVVRAICFGLIALRPHNITLMIVLVVVAVTLGPAFSAAQLGMLAGRLDLDEFTAGNAVRLVTSQVAQVAGFGLGGLVVAALDPAGALTVNAATFAFSAVLLRVLIPSDRMGALDDADPALAAAKGTPTDADAMAPAAEEGFSGLWRDRAARPLVMLSLCIGFFVVPEGLAVPFADHLGASSGQAGMLLAAGALGGALGATLMMRLDTDARVSWANVMAVLCGVPLVVSALLTMVTASVWPAAACWLVSGVLAAYVVQPTSQLMHAIPDAMRSRTVGVLSAMLLGAQGVAVLTFGALAAWTGPATAVGMAGGVGFVLTTASVVLAGRTPARRRTGSRPAPR